MNDKLCYNSRQIFADDISIGKGMERNLELSTIKGSTLISEHIEIVKQNSWTGIYTVVLLHKAKFMVYFTHQIPFDWTKTCGQLK